MYVLLSYVLVRCTCVPLYILSSTSYEAMYEDIEVQGTRYEYVVLAILVLVLRKCDSINVCFRPSLWSPSSQGFHPFCASDIPGYDLTVLSARYEVLQSGSMV